MKLTILQQNLANALVTASRFASTRAQLPVLGYILLSVGKTKAQISATNLEISVAANIGAKVEKEGEICIPARVITELVTSLPEEPLTLESDKEQLKITSSGFSGSVLGMNSSDFPKIPNSFGKEKSFSIPKKELSAALAKVTFAASIDETRPVLTGVLFIWGKGELTLVATDGFRLSLKKIKVQGISGVSHVVLPKLILSEISRASYESDEVAMSLREKEKQAIFEIDNTVLSSRLLEGEYPDFEKIIPKTSHLKVRLDKEEMLRAVKLASVFARESSNILKIKILKESIKITAESGQSGSQETKVDAKVEGGASSGGDFEIAFNFRFLEEFLHSVEGGEVRMEFSNPSSPGLFADSTDQDYVHLIMPVKLQG